MRCSRSTRSASQKLRCSAAPPSTSSVWIPSGHQAPAGGVERVGLQHDRPARGQVRDVPGTAGNGVRGRHHYHLPVGRGGQQRAPSSGVRSRAIEHHPVPRTLRGRRRAPSAAGRRRARCRCRRRWRPSPPAAAGVRRAAAGPEIAVRTPGAAAIRPSALIAALTTTNGPLALVRRQEAGVEAPGGRPPRADVDGDAGRAQHVDAAAGHPRKRIERRHHHAGDARRRESAACTGRCGRRGSTARA